ncbi:MAG: hypothetical protein FJ102_27035, partial [Deltaproteobacteria bacterium]|nr:hypothetical protein [Deltaproteobacteria bacterium]
PADWAAGCLAQPLVATLLRELGVANAHARWNETLDRVRAAVRGSKP